VLIRNQRNHKNQKKINMMSFNFRTKTTTMTRKMVGSRNPFLVPRVQYFAWNGVSVQKVVTVEKSVMKVVPFGVITRLDKVFFKELTDAKVTIESFVKMLGFKNSNVTFVLHLSVCAKNVMKGEAFLRDNKIKVLYGIE
jgi:hypothetical protein